MSDLGDKILGIGVVRPGDSLIIRVKETPYRTVEQEVRETAESLRQRLPENVRIVVVSEGIEVTVLRTGESA